MQRRPAPQRPARRRRAYPARGAVPRRRLVEQALADLAAATESERPELEEQLGSTRAEIARVERKLERYFEGFEDGRLAADLFQERVRGHRDRLEALRERETELVARLGTPAHTPPDGAALAGLAD